MLVSRRKRYLSGSDWVINTMDYMMKTATGAGNMSQVVLMLDAPVEEAELRSLLAGFVKQFPVLHGKVSRDILLAPFWKIPARAGRGVSLAFHRSDGGSSNGSLLPLLEESVNTPFPEDEDHLAFHLYTNGNRSALSLTFDHRIFDARGAELFLSLFQKSLSDGAGAVSGDIAFHSTRALTGWSRKFMAGRNVNRRIIALSKSSPEAIPLPPPSGRRHCYHLLSFNEQETAAIYDRAYEEAGYLMESPYLLSVVMQSMHDFFKDRPETGDSYLVPVTVDLRPGQDAVQEIFFNYVSYLFYQVPRSAVEDRRVLIALLKQQMFDQVKSGFAKDLAEASLLTRIAPLPLLGKVLHLPMKGKMATFAFSHLGKSSYQHPRFMGSAVTDIFHMPRVPAPPGLGFFSNYYNKRLNLIISYLDGLLSKSDVRMLEAGIRSRFGVGNA